MQSRKEGEPRPLTALVASSDEESAVRVCIHRGSQEIGAAAWRSSKTAGACSSTSAARSTPDLTPSWPSGVAGLTTGDTSWVGVVVSPGHLDGDFHGPRSVSTLSTQETAPRSRLHRVEYGERSRQEGSVTGDADAT